MNAFLRMDRMVITPRLMLGVSEFNKSPDDYSPKLMMGVMITNNTVSLLTDSMFMAPRLMLGVREYNQYECLFTHGSDGFPPKVENHSK
jgi:hypothetical protein